MYRTAFFLLIYLLCGSPLWAIQTPTLIDMVVEGPNVRPQALVFEQGHEYLLVVTNQNDYPMRFFYDKFGQHVHTRYLHGTSNVTQDSFLLVQRAKVFWHFSAGEPGNFAFYISNPSLNLHGQKGNITINPERKETEEEPETPA